jgi:hypothetical protein
LQAFPNISWALARNPVISRILMTKYPPNHGYWKHLDDLVTDLRSAGCKGIQEKIVDVANNPSKFESTVSEFEIARQFTRKAKKVEMLTDDFLPGKSPDMHVVDTNGEYYVEVVRFSEDEGLSIILNELRRMLHDHSKSFQVDVTLSSELSIPVVGHTDRAAKDAKTKSIMTKFETELVGTSDADLPKEVVIDEVKFEIVKSRTGTGFPGFINGQAIEVPSDKFVQRIRYLVADPKFGKALKRVKWTGDHLKKRYLVAIDCEQDVDEEDLIEALLGRRKTLLLKSPIVKVPSEIAGAAANSWKRFLEEVHMLPKGQMIFSSYGVYLTDSICRNVSGVVVYVRLGEELLFIPNPFADSIINDSNLVNFIT